jgi:hypothetical protein
VLSERLQILNDLPALVDYFCEQEGLIKPTHGFFIGKKKKRELEEAAKCDIVYATFQLAKEGIDIPRLDFLALVTPASEVEQPIGRICRDIPNKPQPVVADYVDYEISRCVSQYRSRCKLYKRLGLEIVGDKR